MMHQPIKYRSDIDGLRALAVLAVVFYHADWWPFTGGYVGVDVFFVISGYLITTIISREMQEGRFSFLNFYERRIRRILPALFAVLSFCSVFAYALLSVNQYREFSGTLTATMFFLSNVSLWSYIGDHFGSAEQLRPLLHTWSISIVEQFYILFPPILLFLYFLSRRIGRTISQKTIFFISFYGIFFISFALSILAVVLSIAVQGAFFLFPFRAWELSLGVILALGLVPSIHGRYAREILTFFGLTFILFAVFTYDHSTPFPSYAALLPALGAALVIYGGSHHPTWIGRLLGVRPLVFIGLISYSLYLWHWPLLSFLRITNLGEIDFIQGIMAVGLSFILAIVSWRYIERPFRGESGWLSRRQLYAAVLCCSFFFVSFGLYGVWSDGWSERIRFLDHVLYSPEEIRILDAKMHIETDPIWGNPIFGRHVNSLFSEKLRLFNEKNISGQMKEFGIKEADFIKSHGPDYVLTGDSHALYGIERMLFNMSSGIGSEFYSTAYGGRWPIVGLRFGDWNARPIVEEIVYSDRVKTVVLASRYALYLYGYTDFGPAEKDLSFPYNLWEESTGNIIDPKNRELKEAMFAKYFAATVNMLLDAGKRVVIVYPIPEVGYDVPQEMMRRSKAGEDVNGFLHPMRHFWQRNGFIISVMDSLGEHPNLVRIKPHEVFCDGEWCKTAVDGKPLYIESSHLSPTGADLLRPQFDALFKDPKWN